MLSILSFVFSSFWFFVGVIILLFAIAISTSMVLATVIAALRGGTVNISVLSFNEEEQDND